VQDSSGPSACPTNYRTSPYKVTLSLFHVSHFQLPALLTVLSYFTPVSSTEDVVLLDPVNILVDGPSR
jgi:hypothetical protein